MPEPATRDAELVVEFWYFLVWAAAGVAVLVFTLLAIAAIRGRLNDEELPPQRHGNLLLEGTYIGGAAILSAVIFGLGVWYLERIQDDPEPELTIAVVGYQWGWQFDYGSRVVATEPGRQPELVLPVDRAVRFELRSADVIHSFYVPAFAWKQDVVPGYENDLTVVPIATGFYPAHCAEFCGLDHANMNFDVRIVAGDEFDRWLSGSSP